MANKKISDYAELLTPDAADLIEIVDVSDISEAPTGTNKKIQITNLPSGINSVVEDTTPQLGGDLDANTFDFNNVVVADFSINAIGNSGVSNTVNMDNGGFQTITLDQNTTLTVSATKNSRSSLVISGGGSFTVTWVGVTWLTSGGTAPTLDGNDVITFLYDGTTIWGTISNQS